MKTSTKIKIFLGAMLGFAILSTWFGWSDETNKSFWDIMAFVLYNIVIAAIAAAILESFSGNFFKKKKLTLKVFGMKIKLSIFFFLSLIIGFYIKFYILA